MSVHRRGSVPQRLRAVSQPRRSSTPPPRESSKGGGRPRPPKLPSRLRSAPSRWRTALPDLPSSCDAESGQGARAKRSVQEMREKPLRVRTKATGARVPPLPSKPRREFPRSRRGYKRVETSHAAGIWDRGAYVGLRRGPQRAPRLVHREQSVHHGCRPRCVVTHQNLFCEVSGRASAASGIRPKKISKKKIALAFFFGAGVRGGRRGGGREGKACSTSVLKFNFFFPLLWAKFRPPNVPLVCVCCFCVVIFSGSVGYLCCHNPLGEAS